MTDGSVSRASADPDEVIPTLERLNDHAAAIALELRRLYDQLYPEITKEDPRVETSGSMYIAVAAALLEHLLADRVLRRGDIWPMLGYRDLSDAQREKQVDGFLRFSSRGLVFEPFNIFETGIRRIVRAIDPEACGRGNATFQGIYDWLLTRLRRDGEWPGDDGDDALEMLNLYRNLRNTMHNNLRYYPADGTDATLPWRGEEYLFEYGKRPAISEDPRMYPELVRALVDITDKIMRTPTVKALPVPIP